MIPNDQIDMVSNLPKSAPDTEFRIRQVTAGDREGIDRVTELHMELLSFGPMAQFGDPFIREMVYSNALADKLLEVAIAEVDGKPAGFIVYTTDANRFQNSMIRHHLIKAVWVILISLISQPKRILRLPRTLKVLFSRNELPDNSDNIKAEVICFGVKPEYLAPTFVRATKLRIGNTLLQHAFDYFRSNDCKVMRMIVDADNPRPLLFYQSLGAKFTPCVFGGIASYMVTFDL